MNVHNWPCKQSSVFMSHVEEFMAGALYCFQSSKKQCRSICSKDLFPVKIFMCTAQEAESHWQLLNLWQSSLVLHSNLVSRLFRKKEVYIGVIPLMNLGNQDKVLSQVGLVLLKKGHSSLGIEGNQKLTESNWLSWEVWTLEIQRLSDLSKFLKLLAGCNAGIKLLSE